mmetsp:Transcript_14158/g.30892  ORF Transcript_14158/g.30892 Transcript_14158/m.30892 type:complete len:831 (-) Transcript_14158:26-2518(-)|eukprot:CAMPEP_0168850842 /NCGR_PEP_ID=MMETSP0727-20121128/12092_1 /TAXON_ID=265536 /ORGANISM="Amphiprora sp., Strain CCMP467" /LENGTH=830 /DNA_ID=CAMNT_0008904791 /DNA_START=6 /DNA_END=2498 /DNA_ORIENTATION=-
MTSIPEYDVGVDEIKTALSYFQPSSSSKTNTSSSSSNDGVNGDNKKATAPAPQKQPNNNNNNKKNPGKGGKNKQQQQQQKQKPKAPPAAQPTRPWTDELEQDYQRILTVGEECISPEELKKLLTAKGRGSSSSSGDDGNKPPQTFNLYDGFEPSGRMHIAQGVFKAMNVNKCTYPGTNATFVFWVADWFALMNDKMGGDLDKIKTVGHYLIEVWKAAGMDLTNVVFKWASEEITQQAHVYWPTMLDVARRFNVTRIKKCCQIMGRLEGSLTAAQILYPLMQCTDVFFLKASICQLGVDQRKVNMLAREYCDAAGIKNKPIILSHHMLYGLKAGQEKMSKSDPDSAVFMEDSADDVHRKIMNAYCPSASTTEAAAAAAATKKSDEEQEDAGKESMNLSGDTLKNPCLDYIQNIIFSPPGATFTAGDTTFQDFASVKEAFLSQKITEEQLKGGLIKELNQLLEPVRQHFTNDERAKDLLAKVQQYKKEAKDATANSKKEKVIRRLNLPALNKVPPQSHLVFAPLPTPTPTLQQAVNVLELLRSSSSGPRILYLSDWTARVCNACLAEAKAISAFYTILVAACTALDPELMAQTQVLLQSEAILADPSNYWISVINVGRHFMLNDVMGPTMTDSDGVGSVIGNLMRVADVAGVEPKTLALAAAPESHVEANLVTKFFEAKLPGVAIPTVSQVKGPSVELQKTIKTDNDQYFLLDNPKVAGAPKMKKAFCEPQNVDFCPPIEFAKAFIFGPPSNGTFSVPRKEENGGEVVYKNAEDLTKDFASGALHPSDMKPPLTKIAVSVLDRIDAAVKQGDAKKAAGALKQCQKKMAKQKK